MKRTDLAKSDLKRLVDSAKRLTLYSKDISDALQAKTDADLTALINELKQKYKKGIIVLILEDN